MADLPNGGFPEDDLPEPDEWDILQAEIDREADAASKRGKKPSKADLKQAADDFLKQHKDDVPLDEADMSDAPPALDARIRELEMEIATMKDQALRTMAEADNIRKRSEREVQNAKLYGIEKFATDMLSVYDNLSRALHTLDGQAKDELGENARNLMDGIELTEKNLLSAFERYQVKPVPGMGEKFDPNVHQAVAQIPHSEIEKGHVAAVMQQGFTIGERTLRAAMVAVSTGAAGN